MANEQAREPELVVRFEQDVPHTYVSYAVNMRQVAASVQTIWPDIKRGMPAALRPAIETLMFALRQGGLVKRMLKERGLPEMDKAAPDRDSEAMRCLALCIANDIYNRTFDAQGNQHSWDISRKEFTGAYEGLIRRAPEYDGIGAHAIATTVQGSSEQQPEPATTTV